MKRILFSVLMFAVLTPALLCGTGVCMMNPAQAETTQPCHGQNPDGDDSNPLMLMKDCMGIELMAAGDDVSFETPDQQIDTIAYAWADMKLAYNFMPPGQNGIRGPPTFENARNATPSLILITGRFRI